MTSDEQARPSGVGHRFRTVRRLSGDKEFSRVFGGRRSASDRRIVIYAAANDRSYARLGLTVGRKHGNAVRRNRIKRLLREAFRLEYDGLPAGYDLVCVPRVAEIASLADYRRAIRLVAERAARQAAMGGRSGDKRGTRRRKGRAAPGSTGMPERTPRTTPENKEPNKS